jgi:hypothetical protein
VLKIHLFRRWVVAPMLAVGVVGCSAGSAEPHLRDGRTDPVIAAAGDIACDPTGAHFAGGQGDKANCHEGLTAEQAVAGHYDAVLALGDTQYECGDVSGYEQSYDPSWGRIKSVTRPVIGNHEYGKACHRNDASPYFDYFGAAANGPGGYYSFDLGTWHLIVLNSECNSGKGASAVGGCGTGSPQETWLRADLAAHPRACTLAAWHEPRFSSGEHGDAEQTSDLWNDLVSAHADVVLAGHNHDYERFDPIGTTPALAYQPDTPDVKAKPVFQQPVADPAGIRSFVVGTGGKNHYGFTAPPLEGEQIRNADTYGLLSLTLHPNGYDWAFLPEPGHSFTDAGSGACH